MDCSQHWVLYIETFQYDTFSLNDNNNNKKNQAYTRENEGDNEANICTHTKKKEEKSTLACRKDGSIHWTVAISVVSIVWSSMIRYVRGMVVKRELCKMCLIFTSLLTWQPRNQEMEKEETKRIKRKTYTLKRISHLFMNENAQQIKTIHVE